MVSPVYIRPLLAILVAAAVFGIAAAVVRNGPHGSAPVPSVNQQLPHNIDVALKKAHFSEIQDGLVSWELIADHVDYDKRGDTAYLSGIRMEFPRSGSHGAVTVTADKGDYVSGTKTVKMNGHVHVVTEEGASFKTCSIVYAGATGRFTTADQIVFQQQRLHLTAIGMDLSVEDQQAHFLSSVAASIVSR